jgi:hypothetical protein
MKILNHLNGLSVTTMRRLIKRNNPQVEVIAKVDGGYAVFASRDEYRTWRKQK